MTDHLQERVRATLKGEPTSEVVAALLAEVEEVSCAAAAEHVRLTKAAADPLGSVEDAVELSGRAEQQGVVAERWQRWKALLDDALGAAKARAKNAKRKVIYERAVTRRDRMAKEFGERYPWLCKELVGLIERLGTVEAAIRETNEQLPDGYARIASVEETARNAQFRACPWGRAVVPIANQLRLPNFNHMTTEDHFPFFFAKGKRWDPQKDRYLPDLVKRPHTYPIEGTRFAWK